MSPLSKEEPKYEPKEELKESGIPDWFQTLRSIKGKTPVKPSHFNRCQAWLDRKGITDDRAEAVANDLKAKWGARIGDRRPWPYADVWATFKKWVIRPPFETNGRPRPEHRIPAAPEPGKVTVVTPDVDGVWAKALEQLRSAGIEIERVEEHSAGRSAWIKDPEGHVIELWED